MGEYQANSAEIYTIIKKREDAFDQKYKATLNSQLIIKIEEFRRNQRKLKNKKKNHVTDIFWKGASYIEICKFDKEQRE